jgi:GNAT superfamily N-acetyltransferase
MIRRRRVGPADPAALSYLLKREADAVGAISRFISGEDTPCYAWLVETFGPGGATGRPRTLGFILLSGGTVFILAEPGAATPAWFAPSLLRRTRSLQGLAVDVAVAESAIAEKAVAEAAAAESAAAEAAAAGSAVDCAATEPAPKGPPSGEGIDYILMRLTSDPSPAGLAAGPPDLVVRVAAAADADDLYPLQAGYEREEVLPCGAVFDPAFCRWNLEKLLRSRLCLVAEWRGAAVGKANLNAAAFSRDQIGGVYVDAACRGRGIATRLVAELARLDAESGRRVGLFVKTANLPAIAAYTKAGFVSGPAYRIVYY